MKNMIFGLVLCLLLTGCQTVFLNGYSTSKMETMTYATNFVSSTGFKLNYRVAVPDVGPKVPLLIYLHDIDGCGDDNISQMQRENVGRILQYMVEEKEDAVLIVPQCSVGDSWNGEYLKAVTELTEWYKTSALIDTNRVYLTGFSMGGYGVWKLGLEYPNAFTTLAPVAGGPRLGYPWDEPSIPEQLSGVNIFAVQYYNDRVINPNLTKKIVCDLWNKNSMSAHVFELPVGEHSCDIYKHREFLDCIFWSRRLSALYE